MAKLEALPPKPLLKWHGQPFEAHGHASSFGGPDEQDVG
jgi:hypothetical protein